MKNLASIAFLVVAGAACTNDIVQELHPAAPQAKARPPETCEIGGCNGTSCTEQGQEALSVCVYKQEYACYRDARCERQDDGTCGWTRDSDLVACLANPPPVAGPQDLPPPPSSSPMAARTEPKAAQQHE